MIRKLITDLIEDMDEELLVVIYNILIRLAGKD